MPLSINFLTTLATCLPKVFRIINYRFMQIITISNHFYFTEGQTQNDLFIQSNRQLTCTCRNRTVRWYLFPRLAKVPKVPMEPRERERGRFWPVFFTHHRIQGLSSSSFFGKEWKPAKETKQQTLWTQKRVSMDCRPSEWMSWLCMRINKIHLAS